MARRNTKKFFSHDALKPNVLEEAKRQTLIQSTASSLRLSGIKVTDNEVEQIINHSLLNSVFKKDIESILSQKQLAVWKYFQKVNEATPKEISNNTKVARPTVNQALDKLLRLGKIERLGLGRGTRYIKTKV